jgi:DNA-directed RNA polymerase subunit RPC12/RpoP
MTIRYICPYCGTEYAKLTDATIGEVSLGLASLTDDERKHIISYETNGDVIAKVTCQYCSEAIYRNPELIHPLQ